MPDVAPTVQQDVARLAATPEVRSAFNWLRTQEPQLAQWQMEMARIPAPPFGESARGAWLAERFRPAGEGPRLYFQRVPEGKTAKNRVHLDIRVAGREVRGEERKRLVSEKVERLVQAGASIAWANETIRGDSIAMRDPEGNEFCVS